MLTPCSGARAGSRPKKETLALNGGPKAVKKRVHRGPRWGDVEQKQLNAMLRQDSLFYWQGPQTKQFIASFQEVCPTKYVQTCSSGTAAIHIAVAACGIAPGDEVITSPITDIGTVIGVIYQQGVPVFADLGPCTYNLDVADVESRITPKTKAIIAVHLTGNPCDLDALKALADRRHLILIEDCAQAWGAKYRGRPIGTVGHIACFSLQNSKHVTCGDGGVVASNDERFGPLLQKYGDKGGDRIKGGGFQAFSTNYRMSEPQAAVAAAQLTRLEGIASNRARLGNLLSRAHRGHSRHPPTRGPSPGSRRLLVLLHAIRSQGVPLRPGGIRQGARGGRRGRPALATSACRSMANPSFANMASSRATGPSKRWA